MNANRTLSGVLPHRARVEAADPDFEQSWFHALHGLHDEAHHQAHDPLHVCVPVVMGKLLHPENESDHGATCGDTSVDHRCGDTEADQGGTWREITTMHSERNQRIAQMHTKVKGSGGMTDGTCAECGHLWPCPTYHVAVGWGLDTFYECEEAGWCSHAGVRLV